MAARQAQPESTLTRVDATLASKWLMLSAEEVTRPIRPSHVAFLADQMKAGRWRVVGSTALSFLGSLDNDTARLIDGRCILMAVMQADTPINIFVAQRVDEGAELVVNTGKTMLFHDLLRTMRKAPNVMVLGAMTRALYAAERGLLSPLASGGGKLRVSNEELLGFFDANPGIVESGQAASNAANQLPARASLTALGTAHYMFTMIDATAAEEFFAGIRGNAHPDLRRFFNQNSTLQPPHRAVIQIAAITKQWNAWRAGQARPASNTAKWIPTREEWPIPQ